jgi:hypothetical protein
VAITDTLGALRTVIEIEATSVFTRWGADDGLPCIFRGLFQKRKNPNSKNHTYPTSLITIRLSVSTIISEKNQLRMKS